MQLYLIFQGMANIKELVKFQAIKSCISIFIICLGKRAELCYQSLQTFESESSITFEKIPWGA
jgi:hypothetical protein